MTRALGLRGMRAFGLVGLFTLGSVACGGEESTSPLSSAASAGSGGAASGGTAGAPNGGAAGASGGGLGGAAGKGGGGGSAGSAGSSGSGGSAGAGGSSGQLPWLHVDGNLIKDPQGNTVILRGVSLIDIGTTEEWEGGVSEMIDRLTNASDAQGSSPGWATKVVRLPVVPDDTALDSPSQYHAGSTAYYDDVLRPAVDYARQKGLYAIIDWHYVDDTSSHRQTTAAFWTDIAPRFANDSHVMFELYNEPINDGNWTEVRQDMQDWYDIVRDAAPQNLVLVGTPNWCQLVGASATQPIDGTNVAYVAHMYPQHWAQTSLRDEIATAAAAHPVFVTEWGFQQGSNDILDGTITSYGAPFKQFVEQQGVSWTAWCASSSWGPPMFNDDYSLRVGEGEMGGFAKDWLYEKRNDDLPTP